MRAANRILVVAAHPDDEVLGCGGTIARLAQAGSSVHVAILGEGITSRRLTRDATSVEDLEALRKCSHKAAGLLGATGLTTYSLPDNRFDTIPLLDLVKIVEELVERLQPYQIFTHSGGDLNIDHALVHRAVLTATRPVSGCHVAEIYAFEIPSSTEWSFGQFSPAFRPNVFVDISATLESKVQALRTYENEIRPFPHPRSPELVRAISQQRGSSAGLGHAEAFELVRMIIEG